MLPLNDFTPLNTKYSMLNGMAATERPATERHGRYRAAWPLAERHGRFISGVAALRFTAAWPLAAARPLYLIRLGQM